jgi:type III pantothenate kinase
MSRQATERHLLVDLGNSSVKIGEVLPEEQIQLLDAGRERVEALQAISLRAPQWSGSPSDLLSRVWGKESITWHLASVNPPATSQWLDRVQAERPHDQLRLLSRVDFAMQVEVTHPDRLGIDRLAAAAAAAILKRDQVGAVVIDAGTATTVDAISADGRFLGGAILASPALMLRSLAEHTRQLPRLDDRDAIQPPPSIGSDTEGALRSGAFWGQVGAVRMLIEQHCRVLGTEIDLFLCGGIASGLEQFMLPIPKRRPGLVLAGIASTL